MKENIAADANLLDLERDGKSENKNLQEKKSDGDHHACFLHNFFTFGMVLVGINQRRKSTRGDPF